MLMCHLMKSNALLLSALMMSPLAAQTQDAPSIFTALPSPAREMQTAPAQEIYSTRAQIPAGDYELIADVRELPALAQLLAAPGGAIPLEAATLVSTKGNLSQLIDYIPLLSLNSLINREQETIQWHERALKRERELYDARSEKAKQEDENTKRRIKHYEEAVEKDKQQLVPILAEWAKQLKAAPAFSVKPAYLSLQFTQPLGEQMTDFLNATPPPFLKSIVVNGTPGYELDVSALPASYKNLFQEKLQGTPTLFFHLVDADKLVVVLGTGTEALDALKSGGAKMAADAITVPRAVKAHLWLDASVTQTVSSLNFQALKEAQLFSKGDDKLVGSYCLERLIDSLQRLLPQFTEGIGMQLWTQDGDIYGKLHTAMSNYQLASAPPLGAQLASRPDIAVYGELSPLPEEQSAALAEIPLAIMIVFLDAMDDFRAEFYASDTPVPSQAEKLVKYKNATQSVLKLLPSMAGNVGLFAKAQTPQEGEDAQSTRALVGAFAGIKDKAQLTSDFHAAVDTVTRAFNCSDKERKEVVEGLSQYASNTAEEGIYFRAGNKLLVFGGDRETVEALVAGENAPAAPAMSGARFMWRGKLLQDELSPPLREKIEGFYLRLDSAGEKKDVYFKLDMK